MKSNALNSLFSLSMFLGFLKASTSPSGEGKSVLCPVWGAGSGNWCGSCQVPWTKTSQGPCGLSQRFKTECFLSLHENNSWYTKTWFDFQKPQS